MSYGRVQYFTVTFGSKQITEFEEFEEKEFPNHAIEIQQLYAALEQMIRRGVQKRYFRPEEAAFYLPNPDEDTKKANDVDFGIRLYCVIPLGNVIILLNGDIKTTLKAQECPNVWPHASRAMKIALKLEKAARDGELDSESDLLELEIDI